MNQVLVALGHQDTDPAGLRVIGGIEGSDSVSILGASSDHLVIDAGDSGLRPGDEVSFSTDYGALLRAMTSPFVQRHYFSGPSG